MGFGYPAGVPDYIVAGAASNMGGSSDTVLTTADVYKIFPQFETTVEDFMIEMFLGMAQTSIYESKWGDRWKYAICLFVAHFATLYLESGTDKNSNASRVIADAQVRGLPTSKSVGDVSISYDFDIITRDINGWANWKSTKFGIQLASLGLCSIVLLNPWSKWPKQSTRHPTFLKPCTS
jgi:hypothetical protein